jgi:hypothetical protein
MICSREHDIGRQRVAGPHGSSAAAQHASAMTCKCHASAVFPAACGSKLRSNICDLPSQRCALHQQNACENSVSDDEYKTVFSLQG